MENNDICRGNIKVFLVEDVLDVEDIQLIDEDVKISYNDKENNKENTSKGLNMDNVCNVREAKENI